MPNYYTPCNLRRLHHAEFQQLLTRMLEDFKSANLKSKDDDFTRLLNTIKTKVTTLQSALEQVRASERSQNIQELDTGRDRAFQALANSFKPYRYSTVANEKAAYIALNLLFKQYKRLTHKNYEEETALINSLLSKLNSAEYQDDVTALGISKFVTVLSSAQTAFEAQFNARSKENLGRTFYNVKELRHTLTEDYQVFIDYVGVLALVKSDPFYKNAIGVINNSRKYYADVIARRSPKEKAQLFATISPTA
ncbi:MAG: DUF6261 family protein [Aerococcaceae bacterium]|nr:DUF6261 family protein [Aerococcaceae bacterium]